MNTSPESNSPLETTASLDLPEVDAKAPAAPTRRNKPLRSQTLLKKRSDVLLLEQPLQSLSSRQWKPYRTLVALLLSLGAVGGIIFAWKGLQPVLISLQRPFVHPVSIPWLKSQDACERTGRIWNKNECWDYEHSPDF